jgi:hypothetical protein
VISDRVRFVLMKLRDPGWSLAEYVNSPQCRKPAQATLHAVMKLRSAGISLGETHQSLAQDQLGLVNLDIWLTALNPFE